MGFINNHTDNFLPSSNPWEKDTTLYSVPQKPLRSKLQDMDYDALHSLLDEMSSVYKTMPMCKDKVTMKKKMMALIQEIKKRDDLEVMTKDERDDNFEISEEPTPVTTHPIVEEPVVSTPVIDDTNDDDLDDILCDEEDIDLDEEMVPPSNDMTNFLIAGALIILIISITNKK